MSIGENLKRIRRDRGWTQGELSLRCKVGFGQISKIERDETDPKLSTIYELMNALGCTADALLIDTEKSSIDSVMAVALERVKQLPEKDKEIILTIIDKYCIAISLQQIADKKVIFGLQAVAEGSTPEMTKKK
ncbi:helix-turn-helix transcriptional regulator [Salmonella enterica subsp. enterica serovar Newport]|uniref:helix-turn-helix domain-containing protein n=1 Tax=Salmonella enterica TaxID=28901 RepID=UPI0009AC00E1|nr:helix-turn-helix transcriptional regulator [Salmonella enterica]ECG8572487.1 helix-turn-helix transcriptional regulator [Salmonella enterica subsp. diarizonae]ECM1812308.1 helix-turn-helix transcriptional regulator [Salmonella enterica subsp. enterica serovar Newport]MKU04732.1 XRE family transcriptional regulator [Salmonella enterica subsp. enterica serovar Kinondoni]EHM0997618.1 helix-turn-helix transcriptional regulator [Salmonella enterica subsp. enterica serovar Newport]ELF6076846.1 he